MPGLWGRVRDRKQDTHLRGIRWKMIEQNTFGLLAHRHMPINQRETDRDYSLISTASSLSIMMRSLLKCHYFVRKIPRVLESPVKP